MATIHHTTVSLRVFGKDVHPDTITQLFKCTPSKAGKAGAVIHYKNGKTRTLKEGFWILEATNKNSTLEAQIGGLFQLLPSDIAMWHQLHSTYRVDVFCGVFMNHMNEGFSLSPTIMHGLSMRKLEIDFDIYGPTEAFEEGLDEFY